MDVVRELNAVDFDDIDTALKDYYNDRERCRSDALCKKHAKQKLVQRIEEILERRRREVQ